MSNWSKLPLKSLEGAQPRASDLWSLQWRGVELVKLRYGLVRHVEWPPTKFQILDDGETEALEALRLAVEKAACKLVVDRLARLARSRLQLTVTLKRLEMPQAWIDSVLEKIVKLGYIDESSMSASVTKRLKRQGKSRRQMEECLRAKGLSACESISEQDELDSALAHLERWSKREAISLNPNRYLQRLAQRGFEASAVYQAYEKWKEIHEG